MNHFCLEFQTIYFWRAEHFCEMQHHAECSRNRWQDTWHFFGKWPLSPWGHRLHLWAAPGLCFLSFVALLLVGWTWGWCFAAQWQQQNCFKIKASATSLVKKVPSQAGISGLGRAFSQSQTLISKICKTESIYLRGKSQHLHLIIWILLASQGSYSWERCETAI